MAFTYLERAEFVTVLSRMGWELRADTLWSPTSGLCFNDSHFQQWGPAEMLKTFAARVTRIERAGLPNWEASAGENRQVCEAATAAGRVGA